MNSYETLFEQRASAYHAAMKQFPDARKSEFLNLTSRMAPLDGMKLLDIPAGGGYLKHYLPIGCDYYGHEPCLGFELDASVHGSTGLLVPTPFADCMFDVVCSLAGLHHVENKGELFLELHRVSKPDGLLIACDVAEQSPVANFLDNFVGAHNSTGHEGLYLNKQTEIELSAARWTVIDSVCTPLVWHFDNDQDLVCFATMLFDMRDVDPIQVSTAMKNILGVDIHPDGSIDLQWTLHTMVARCSK